MVRHTFKILQHMLEVFKSVSDHFTTLLSKGLIMILTVTVDYDIINYSYGFCAPFVIIAPIYNSCSSDL